MQLGRGAASGVVQTYACLVATLLHVVSDLCLCILHKRLALATLGIVLIAWTRCAHIRNLLCREW